MACEPPTDPGGAAGPLPTSTLGCNILPQGNPPGWGQELHNGQVLTVLRIDNTCAPISFDLGAAEEQLQAWGIQSLLRSRLSQLCVVMETGVSPVVEGPEDLEDAPLLPSTPGPQERPLTQTELYQLVPEAEPEIMKPNGTHDLINLTATRGEWCCPHSADDENRGQAG